MDELSKETDKILAAARARLKEARDVEQPHIERAESDLRFLSGEEQWPSEDRRIREDEGKPTLVFNALPQYARKICGQVRQLNPAVKVSAADDMASEDVAEIYEGLIREIEYRCDAASIYEGATESAVHGGIGHFRIRTDYCDQESFDQHIVIERIWNPFSVYYDPMAKDPTRKDAKFCFVAEQMREDDFKAAYPKAQLTDFKDAKLPEWYLDWRGGKMVTVAEYFWLDHDEYEIALTPMGQVIRGPFPEGLQITRKRTVRKPKVMWAKTNGEDILEGPQRVPGEYIPIIAITGEELHIGEEVYRSGAIRFAKDAQVAYNVMRTASVETTLLQPRAPYLVTGKQIAGLKTFWERANTANVPYLVYNPDPAAPTPSRVPPPMASSALVQEAQIAAEDMKRTTGIYDASLGARSNETSGVAIQSRQREAEISTSVYSDNMVKAVGHAGRIIVGMIPEVYDAQRVVRLLGEDGQEKIETINQMMIGPDGIVKRNDMTSGKYAVRVSVGPAYTTKKQEAATNMLDFMQRVPQAAPLIADLIAGSQEWPDSERIAERLRKTLPPQLLEDDEKDQQDQQAVQMKQMQAQQAQQQAQMQAMAQEAELKKTIAAAEKAAADAEKARAEAEKAKLETAQMLAQLRMVAGMNVGPVAPMPGYTG